MIVRRIIDEALPVGLVSHIRRAGCDIEPFPTVWRGLADSEMLDRFDADGGGILVTCDRNIRFQQSVERRAVGIVVLPGQRLAQLLPIVREIACAVESASVRNVVIVDRSGRVSHSSD